MAISHQLCCEVEEYLISTVQQKLDKYSPETDSMPFHYRLLGKGHMSMYSFIHSMNTTLGTSIFEQVGAKIAKENPSVNTAIGQYKLEGFKIYESVTAIERIVDDLQAKIKEPDKISEIKEVLAACKAGILSQKSKKTVDLFISMNDGREFYFDLKTAKPNKEGFVSLKKKMLEWVAVRASLIDEDRYTELALKIHTMIAIPYNPYAPSPYDRWTLGGLFSADDLLVGEEFWNFLGGENTFEDLLDVFEIVGLNIQKEISQKFQNVGLK